jgi:hypothetical protein
MSSWTTPVTDWDSADYYNFGDLNRVESNTEYVYDQLVFMGYISSALTLVKTRTNTYLEYYDSLNRIENNMLTLKNSSYEPLGWITPITNWVSVTDIFDYTDANRLESNILALKEMMDGIISNILYCGDAQASICGKGNTLF